MGTSGGAWEHLVLREGEGTADELARLGAEGWELVAVVPTRVAGDDRLYLKRLAPDLRRRVTLDQRRALFAARALAEPPAGGGE